MSLIEDNQRGRFTANKEIIYSTTEHEEAEKIMFEIYQNTANKKVYSALIDIRYEIRAAKKLQAQMEQREERENAETVSETIPEELKEK